VRLDVAFLPRDLRDADIEALYAAMRQSGRAVRGRPSPVLRRLLDARTDTAAARRPLSDATMRRVHATAMSALGAAVQRCRACDLWKDATQAVIGEGPRKARLMMVGETPDDREDLEGHPFVGPAGGVLDQGLERAGIARREVYITNVVKHFRYKARGTRRIHQKPDRWQVKACLPWLGAELEMVCPEALVCLGATAAQALLATAQGGRVMRRVGHRGHGVRAQRANRHHSGGGATPNLRLWRSCRPAVTATAGRRRGALSAPCRLPYSVSRRSRTAAGHPFGSPPMRAAGRTFRRV